MKSMNTKSAIWLALATACAFLAATVVSTRARASVAHVLPPTACQLHIGDQDNLMFVNGGLEYAQGPDTLIQCNLPRDSTESTTGLALLEISFSAPPSATNTLSCDLYFEDRFGNMTVSTQQPHQDAVDGAKQILRWTAADLSGFPSVAKGKYDLLCDMTPIGTTIFSIYYVEN